MPRQTGNQVTRTKGQSRPGKPLSLNGTRLIFQGFFLVLFVWLSLCTWARVRWGETPEMAGWPVSLFLDLDPLALLGSLLATRSVHVAGSGWDTVGSFGVVLGLLTLVVTFFFGRVFCGWVCPLGTLQQLVGRLQRGRERSSMIALNRYQKSASLKYALLLFFLATALCGSLQLGLLDPIALLSRSFALAVWPLVDLATRPLLVKLELVPIYPAATPGYAGGWLIGLMLLALLAAVTWRPRFFCRAFCPLGALLGLLSRWAPFHLRRFVPACTDCGVCHSACQGAADPAGKVRLAECMVCLNCTADCPTGALTYGPTRPDAPVTICAQPGRRGLLLGTLAGLVVAPLAKLTGSRGPTFGARLIRPPGSRQEDDFLARCLKCGQCSRVCPTGVLQPAWCEAGAEGVWTPVLDMRRGYCDPECVACGQVCPTGAIAKLTPARKGGSAPGLSGQGPVVIGTAFIDTTRCLPWVLQTPCMVCEEVCPVSPKAVKIKPAGTGENTEIRLPYVDPGLCTGCGLCEYSCPVVDLRAVRVTPVGESRSRGFGASRDRSLLFPK